VDKFVQLTYMIKLAFQIGFCAKPLVLMEQEEARLGISADAEYDFSTT
jgi:hypothetical protein